ncbi:MAG TPA: hypothetical protein VE863_08680 [Pyrinomonadaceae bacterium]|jgi:hypothetical protein|nr:hypothetical protein [Pyrinomonadaceae bacterium]
MRRVFTLFVLAATFGGVVGASAHEPEGSCPMNMPDCCKHVQLNDSTPEVSMARLCCSLNCSEPGSTGSSSSASVFSEQGTLPTAGAIPNALPLHRRILVREQSANRHDSNPKYIQHLALLI